MTPDVLLARQPIFNLKLKVVAYELLFRKRFSEPDRSVDGDYASSQVLVNAFNELSIEEIVGNAIAFINFTRALILELPPVDEHRCVIEVLEDVEIDKELIQGIKNAKQLGYQIALDDFVFHQKSPEIVALADIIKLDVLALSKHELANEVKKLKPYHVILLAEKVETYEIFEYCKRLGFTLFQGFFLSKPQNVMGAALPPSKLTVLNLLGKTQDPRIEVKEIEDALAMDPILTYKLLMMINAAAYRRRRKIESLHDAIVLLGLNRLKSWATIVALTDLSDKPQELMMVAIMRGKMCELIALAMQQTDTEKFFMVGLLSLLDAFFDRPLEIILNKLPLSGDSQSAILNHTGVIGFVLATTIAYERAEWDQIAWQALEDVHINSNDLRNIYLDSIKASLELMGPMLRAR
jgi:EAL and modified HD-GYP domain-containing signal transduction protein